MHRHPLFVVAVFPFLLCYVVSSSVSHPTSLRSSFKADIDRDGKLDVFLYELTKIHDHFDGRLTIANAQGEILWNHTWQMSQNDLDDLLREEGGITVEDWVKRFFDGSTTYGARYQETKLHDQDITAEFIEFYGKGESVSVPEIIANILAQEKNATLTYRASWREDMTVIVYVPKLNKFMRYSGFGY
jgi:hypothetical protein